MADFTTWTSLLGALRTALANRDLAVGEYRAPDGTFVRYRSAKELLDLIAWVEGKADAEAATAGVAVRRTTAVPRSDRW